MADLQALVDGELEDDSEEKLSAAIIMDQLQAAINEEPPQRRKHGSSQPGRAANLQRDRGEGHDRMFNDYFSETPVFGEALFRRRYRMYRALFFRIMDAVVAHDLYFVQKCDALGVSGLSSIQKITAALRMLAYGIAADATDEYCQIGESTAMEAMKRFIRCIRSCFQKEYLRLPTREDYHKQLQINKARGFPGMFASLDCMHWNWKNCPVAWQGQFQDKDKNRSIILEAVADQSLWIWHAFFGLPGGNNDINVLDRSPLIRDLLSGAGNDMSFTVNGHVYPRYYLLSDGIYPQWSCFVQTIHEPQDEKHGHFAMMQEGARKDVERAFGVLQSRFAIIANPVRQWDMQTIHDIMYACIVLHNMIIEDEQHDYTSYNDIHHPYMRRGLTFEEYARGSEELQSTHMHYKLRADLIDHLWNIKGTSMH